MAPNEPIACMGDLRAVAGVQAHVDAYRAAFERLVGTERFAGGFRWRFRAAPGLDAELRRIAEREAACCRFLAFEVTRHGEYVVWETRADDRAATFLDEFSRLPERLRAEPRPGHDLLALEQAAEAAGLAFTGEGVGRASLDVPRKQTASAAPRSGDRTATRMSGPA